MIKDTREQARLLAWVSLFVLMEHDGGIIDKSPAYMEEKVCRVKDAYWMLTSLHILLRPVVYAWGKKWGVDFESLVKQMEKDYDKLPHDEYQKKYGIV